MDIFCLIDSKDSIIGYTDITDKPSDFEKLISLGLDPLIYNLRWFNENEAMVREYWWGTEPFKIYRSNLTPPIEVTSIHTGESLPTGYAASPTPWHLNKMI